MANPYEWSEDREPRRYERGEQDARRAAGRHAEQERSWGPEGGVGRDLGRDPGRDPGREPRRQEGDYASGWWGEEAAREGYSVPGPYGRPSEQRGSVHRDDPSNFDRYEEPDRRRDDRVMSADRGADQGRGGLERGWRRVSEGVRHAFDENRPGAYNADPRRAGGMFGGEDPPDSLFSHADGAGGLGARRTGPHRGKGPKGYARPDSRILEDVSDRLADDGRLDASDIEVKVEAGEVTLGGQVASREDKRRAEDLAEQVSGVKHLQNNLRVRPPNASAETAADPAATSGQNGTAAAAAGTMGSTGGARSRPRPS